MYTPYALALHFTALTSAGIVVFLLTRRNIAGAEMFMLMMVAVTIWAFCAGNEAAAVGLEHKIFWAKLEYLGAVLTPTFFFIFSLEFRHLTTFLTPRYLIFYSIVPFAMLGLVMTNETHHLFWTGFTPGPPGSNSFIYEHGPAFYLLVGYDYLLVVITMFILIQGWWRGRPPYRQQLGIIILGAICPIVCSLLYVLDLNPFPGLDLPPITFLMTGMIITWGIFRFRLFNLVPIARHTLIEYMNDGVLVVDNQNRLIDLNPAAERYLGQKVESALGQNLTEFLHNWPSLLEIVLGAQDLETEIQTDDSPHRYFEVRVRTLRRRGKLSGRLIVLHDITRRRQAEKELARQNEELALINRIGLAVATGLDLQETIKTLHKQCSAVLPIDIFYVGLYDEKRGLIHVPLYYERGEYHTDLIRDINENPGSLGAIIRTGRTLYLRDSYRSVTAPLTRAVIEEKRARSYLGLPLITREKVIGAIVIQSYRPVAYREDQVKLMERIAVHAAIALENAQLYAEVQRLAIVDELTGIYNYRGLLEIGKREVERARRFGHPLSALFFDIDDFREFNNRYSHTVGNIVLKEIAQTIARNLRTVDVFARFGGDEFVILLPESSLEQAQETAHRLDALVAEHTLSTSAGQFTVTISIGIAELTPDLPDLNALIEKANQAERIVKNHRNGRSASSPHKLLPN
ncbi:MAG: diguanylate cyclase [Anaerolineales bacterium]|nr:diguanylate cyclase [Anaerolineales bacterium]